MNFTVPYTLKEVGGGGKTYKNNAILKQEAHTMGHFTNLNSIIFPI